MAALTPEEEKQRNKRIGDAVFFGLIVVAPCLLAVIIAAAVLR